MSKHWAGWTEREYAADASPENVLREGMQKLEAEQDRHDEAMQKLQNEYEEEKRKLETSLMGNLDRMKNWFASFNPRNIMRTFDPPSIRTADAFGYDKNDSREDGPGTCLVVWNKQAGDKTDAELLCQAFLNLGFQVELKKNLSERDTWKYLKQAGEARYQGRNSFVLAFISEGTPNYIKSADGKKIELKKIVDSFHPANATGLRRIPKLFLFQCNQENGGKAIVKQEEAGFAPKYNDAFVLCSTHRRFLPTMRDFLGRGFVGEFQDVMSKVADELARDSTPQESVGMESTLGNKIFFSQKDLGGKL